MSGNGIILLFITMLLFCMSAVGIATTPDHFANSAANPTNPQLEMRSQAIAENMRALMNNLAPYREESTKTNSLTQNNGFVTLNVQNTLTDNNLAQNTAKNEIKIAIEPDDVGNKWLLISYAGNDTRLCPLVTRNLREITPKNTHILTFVNANPTSFTIYMENSDGSQYWNNRITGPSGLMPHANCPILAEPILQQQSPF